MNFLRLFSVAFITVYFSCNLSGQTIRPEIDQEDQVKAHNAKTELLRKIQANIAFKQNGGIILDGPGEDDGRRTTPKKNISKKDDSPEVKTKPKGSN